MSSIVANAQETAPTPVVEAGANYSFVRSNRAQDFGSRNENGGSGYAIYNFNKVVGAVADFGAYHNGNGNRIPSDQTTFTYLFGPRFSWRMSRVVPYAQFLFGGARLFGSGTLPDGLTYSSHQNSFATAAGGGVDIILTKHIAVKPIQVEYLMTQLPEFLSNRDSRQNGLRYSAGVVFRFGSK